MVSEGKTINEKIDELKEKVDWFYGEDFDLEKAVGEYGSALALAKEIEQDLENMRNEIKVIDEDFSK